MFSSQPLPKHVRVATLLCASIAFAACHHGKAAGPAASAPKASAAPKMPAEVTPANIAKGDSLFNNGTCQRCHGKLGVGAANGPSLVAGPFLHSTGSYEDIVKTITTGVPKPEVKDATRRFGMNPRGGGNTPLDDAQVKLVAAYVYSISRNKK